MEGVSIDLGTANTVVWDSEDGLVFNEPTMMALSFDGGRHSDVIGIGHAAEELVGRSPDGVEVVRPLRDGVITDLETTRRFLREVLQGIAPTWLQRRRLSVVIGVPAGATALERRALLEAAEEVAEAVAPVTTEIFSALTGCLEDLPPQSVSDVMSEGVVVVGGGSLVPGFGKRLEDAFGFSALMAQDPLTRVAEGGARCLSNKDALAAYAVS